jgi:hypothetical protein
MILENEITVIHFGSNEFQPEKFKPIQNIGWNKPNGGLWTSPIDSTWGWLDWCNNEGFRTQSLESSFKLKLKVGSKIALIDSESDLRKLHLYKGYLNQLLPDFERLSKEYDAIWLTERGQIDTRHSHPANLYGWDCETIFIMSPDCFNIVK